MKKIRVYLNLIFENNSGQVLLIVILLMSIALGLSLGITSRITNSISRTSTLDSFQKVTAAAEAGIELELNKSDAQIFTTPTTRTYTFPASGTKSDISVTALTSPATGFFMFENVVPGETVTYNLVNFTSVDPASSGFSNNVPSTATVTFSAPSNTPFMVTIISHNSTPTSFSSSSSSLNTSDVLSSNNNSGSFTTSNYLYNGSSWVGGVSIPSPLSRPVMIRIKALSAEIPFFGIKLDSAGRVAGSSFTDMTSSIRAIPQGAIITSVGRFTQVGGDPTNRTIEAYKYLDTPASFIDYGGYIDVTSTTP